MQRAPDTLRIGLVTDVGHVDDGTFNQDAYEGLMRAVGDFNLDYEVVETSAPHEYEANLHRLVAEGCSLIVTIGSTTAAQLERVARRYPDVHFLAVDYEPLPESKNITGLTFAEDQAGFIAGALAGLVTESGKVGFVGGVDVPPVLKYQHGFEHGVAYTNRRADVAVAYTDSFTDVDAGRAAGRELAESGADVVFAAGGRSGSAAIQAAAQHGAWVIGVDQDEWITTFDSGEAPGADRLLTSAIKHVDEAVYTAIAYAVEGQLDGQIMHFTLAKEGVGLAPYHVADAEVSSEVRGKIHDVIEGLSDGSIRTRVDSEGEVIESFFDRVTDWNWNSLTIPLLAIVTALIFGAVFIAAFDPEVWAAFSEGLGAGLAASWLAISQAYSSLFVGAFGSPAQLAEGFRIYFQSGDAAELQTALKPLTESLRISTPFIFTGLAVAVGFHGGLFNIGAEGQYFIGGLAATFVGYSVVGLPWMLHLPLAILAAILGGAVWAGIAGYLKAKTGAHEVINTIMLNYIAFRLADYLLQVGGPMARPGDFRPVSPAIELSAYLPQFFPNDPAIRFNAGFLLALAMVVLVWFILYKTTIGFEIRTVGASPRAARTAGIGVARNFVLSMAISGGLAGLAGAHDILGVLHYMPNAFQSGYGFDAIAIALLGKSNPIGVLLAALLFGFLRAGAQRMQAPPASVPIDIISVVQALIIIFIAAPELIRLIYRIRAARAEGETVFTRGWGSV